MTEIKKKIQRVSCLVDGFFVNGYYVLNSRYQLYCESVHLQFTLVNDHHPKKYNIFSSKKCRNIFFCYYYYKENDGMIKGNFFRHSYVFFCSLFNELFVERSLFIVFLSTKLTFV